MSLLFALPAADTCMQSSFEFEDVDVQPSRDEFVKRTMPERFRKKVLKFLDQTKNALTMAKEQIYSSILRLCDRCTGDRYKY